MTKVWVDEGYQSKDAAQAVAGLNLELEMVPKPAGSKGFVLLPRRWVVERTFAWWGRCRWLSKDYEYHTATAEAMIYFAMSRLMLRRLAKRRAA